MWKFVRPMWISIIVLVILSPILALESIGLTISITDYLNTFVAVDQKFFTSDDSVTGTLFSGHCKIIGYTKSHVPDVVCHVSSQELPRTRNSTTRSCDLRMNPEEAVGGIQSKFFGVFELEPLTSTQILLKWSEIFMYHLYVRVILVDMKDCSHTRMRFHEDMRKGHLFGNLVVHHDTFDVLIADDQLCGSEKCRITFNKLGERIGVPMPFQTAFEGVMTTCISEYRKGHRGFFVLGFDNANPKQNRYKLTHVSETGIEKHLTTFQKHRHQYAAISSSHHRYGICVMLMYSTELQCLQYDMNAKIMMNQRMMLSKNSTLLGVHNMAGGGLVLLTSDCYQAQGFFYICRDFMLNKLHKDGHLDSMFTIANHNFLCDMSSRNTRMQVFEGAGEYCFFLTCMYQDRSWGLDEISFKFQFKSACIKKVHMDHKLQIF
ncbi:hypothetical protein QAD02_008989 [Eretmocerus hayati]|uniref:Uncharacterized protein n=1 Tax=Eretmocerus hayati TaxID=131215 RepID=A0ACC2N8D4_9HYME|nr:hypothetical protein QAD02_008989 [Eretmocerus hayati]